MVDRQTFIKLVESQVKKWESEIKELELRAHLFEKSAQSEIQKQINFLKSQLAESQNILEEMKQSSEETWEKTKEQFIISLEEIKNSIERTFSKFLVNEKSM